MITFVHGRRAPELRRGGRAAGRPGRRPAALRARAAPAPVPPSRASGSGWSRRTPAGRRVLRRAARHRPEARSAREFLRPARLRPRPPPRRYGCGFAPDGWDALTKHLRQTRLHPGRSWSPPGWPGRRARGSLIDRFRRRLLWPIRDLAGDVIGFGARRLFDDDDGPKYLNTPETPLYKKSHVLYGVDLAKREIAKQRQAVDRRGLHRRDGLPPGRRADRGRDLRHRVRRRPHRRAAPAADGHRRVRRRDHLHLRRRRGRAEGRAAGVRGRPAVRRADLHRGRARTAWTRASCGWPRATPRCATWSPAGEPLFDVRAALARCARYDLDTAEGRVRGAATRPRRWSPRSRTGRCARSTRRKLAGELGMEVEPVLARGVQPAAGRAARGGGRRPAARAGRRRPAVAGGA